MEVQVWQVVFFGFVCKINAFFDVQVRISKVVYRYLLMLVYAVQSQMKTHDCKLATDSCMGLAFAGVFTVTFASIAGLGLATWFGIEFNAATTQVIVVCSFCFSAVPIF